MVSTVPGTTPLVFDSPHSGTHYPADFRSACSLPTLRRAEDTHVEKIYAFTPALGVAWVEAHFPRIYLDANRDTTELDTTLLDGDWTDPISTDPKVLSKVRLGKGLIWKFTDEGEPIYHRQLTVAEVRARIDQCWRPYHAAVAQALQEPDVRERLARQGLYPSGTTPKAFTTQIAREIDKMKGVAAFAKVSLD